MATGSSTLTEKVMEEQLESILEDAEFNGVDDDEGNPIRLRHTKSFESVGMLTRNKGLVLRMSDGSEFQLTIVRSK